jgi:MFS family permease
MTDARHRLLDVVKGSTAAWSALAAMVSVYFFSYFQRTAIPGTIFDEIQMDMRVSATAVAGLGSMFLAIYAGSQLFVGMAADRFGGRRTLLWGAVLMTMGALWFPLARAPVTLVAARALTGFGASFMYLSIVHEVETLFGPRRFPAIMGIVLFFGYAGGMAATLPFAALAALSGWRGALLEIGLLMVVFGIGAWAVLRRLPASAHTPVTISFRPLRDVVCSPRNYPILLASLTNFSVYFVIQNVVGKKFLQDVAGLTSTRAASFALIMSAVCAVMVFLSGLWLRLSAHRRKPVLLAFGLVLLLGMLLLALGVAFKAPQGVFLTAYILLAISVGSSTTGSTVIKELNRPDCVAQSVAVLNGLAYVGVSVLSILSGWVLDRFESGSILTSTGRLYPSEAYLTLFGILTGVAIFSFLCLTRIRETAPAQAAPHPLDKSLLEEQTCPAALP